VEVSREQRAANLISAARDHQGARQYGQARARLQLAMRYATAGQREAIAAILAEMPEGRGSQR
jgi:hypothetical protein